MRQTTSIATLWACFFIVPYKYFSHLPHSQAIFVSRNMSSKRKAAAGPVSPPTMKKKLQSTTSKTAVAAFFTPTSQKPKTKTEWQERAPASNTPATMLVAHYHPDDQTGDRHKSNGDEQKKKAKVAAFDLDSTLIVTASGKKFGNDPTDWKWWDPIVPNRLQQLHTDGYAVVIFSNQGGLILHPDPKSKVPKKISGERVQNFKKKVNAVLSVLDLPICVYVATGQDIFRKPRSGMWLEMLREKRLSIDDIELGASIFVGDAGGRVESREEKGNGKTAVLSKDFSCSDRNFAFNIGLPFQAPEEYFLGQKPREYVRPIELACYPFATANETYVDVGFKKSENNEIVLFCGPPGSGKSSFFRRYLQSLGYVRINQDTLKSKDKCLKVAESNLEEGNCIVIDNTNADPNTRSHWVALAKRYRVSIRCALFKTPIGICEHNDAVRAMNPQFNPESREILPKMAFNGFMSRYKEPTLDEGFKEILVIDFKFRGTAEEYHIWSKYWT